MEKNTPEQRNLDHSMANFDQNLMQPEWVNLWLKLDDNQLSLSPSREIEERYDNSNSRQS